ncbi:hypothetical protein MRX96_018687 [Rhipicephalus microplus]
MSLCLRRLDRLRSEASSAWTGWLRVVSRRKPVNCRRQLARRSETVGEPRKGRGCWGHRPAWTTLLQRGRRRPRTRAAGLHGNPRVVTAAHAPPCAPVRRGRAITKSETSPYHPAAAARARTTHNACLEGSQHVARADNRSPVPRDTLVFSAQPNPPRCRRHWWQQTRQASSWQKTAEKHGALKAATGTALTGSCGRPAEDEGAELHAELAGGARERRRSCVL